MLKLFKGETSLGTVTADNLGAFTFSSVALAEGANSFTAKATDAANNKSPASTPPVVITLDTTAPAAPAITNATATVASSPVSIVGTAEANSVVELFKGETSLGTVTADNLGAFTFSSVALAEGANSFTAKATDAANNKSPASTPPVVITLDTTAPAAPAITNATATVASSPVSIVGTAEANSVVELFKGETSLGTVTADNLGAFTFSSVALAEGDNSFTTTATDAANNKSVASPAVVITLDTTAPAAPAITNSTATVASSPVSIVGTAEANSVVELFKGETSLGTVTADNLGAFTFSSVALAEGDNSFTATATDAANNKSPVSLAVVITLNTPDTTPPAAPVITNSTATVASSPVSIVGTAEANSVVELFKGETSLGTVTADNLGAFTFSSVALAEGDNSFTATATDAANNKSVASPAVVITLDTTAPAAPAISTTSDIVTQQPISIRGTAEANSTVELFNGGVSVASGTASNTGSFSFSNVALAEGDNSFTAKATDRVGNTSPASPAVVITLNTPDTTPPAAPVITNSTATVVSSPVSIVGTAEANSVVELFKGETSLGTVTADNLGAFTFSSVALAEGDNSFTAKATDAANNKSPASTPPVVITLDTTAPAAPAITNTFTTFSSSPVTLEGTAEANSVVELFKGETSLGTVTADNLGAFTFSSVALAEGDNSFTAKATDQSGNTSVVSSPVVITLDTTPPAAPAITNSTATVVSSPVSIVGTAEANSVVELFKGETSLGTVTADNLGAFTFSSVALAEGDNSFTTTATDAANNKSPASLAVVITLNTPDTTPPAAPAITNATSYCSILSC